MKSAGDSSPGGPSMAVPTQEPRAESKLSEIVETFKAVCRMCHGGCGTIVHMVKGTIKKVVGDKLNPINKGALCSKAGPASIEQLYHPHPLHPPLMRGGGPRPGPRGPRAVGG